MGTALRNEVARIVEISWIDSSERGRPSVGDGDSISIHII